jgi:hypothetical protein
MGVAVTGVVMVVVRMLGRGVRHDAAPR